MTKELVTGNPGAIELSVGGLPSSVHNMTPGNAFVKTLAAIPPAPGIATHSIVAVKGRGPIEKDDDGVVEYVSAHFRGADSEVVIRSAHSVQGNPLAIAEVRRILRLHADQACADGVGCPGTPPRTSEGPQP